MSFTIATRALTIAVRCRRPRRLAPGCSLPRFAYPPLIRAVRDEARR